LTRLIVIQQLVATAQAVILLHETQSHWTVDESCGVKTGVFSVQQFIVARYTSDETDLVHVSVSS